MVLCSYDHWSLRLPRSAPLTPWLCRATTAQKTNEKRKETTPNKNVDKGVTYKVTVDIVEICCRKMPALRPLRSADRHKKKGSKGTNHCSFISERNGIACSQTGGSFRPDDTNDRGTVG